MASTPKYKLTYFNAKAGAEPIRLLLAACDVKYEDVRVNMEEWQKIKPTTPQCSLPTFEIDGKIHVQSPAIARYLAREYGMYGKNNMDSFIIDQIQDTIADLMLFMRTAIRTGDQAQMAEKEKELHDAHAPRYLGYIEKLIESSGKDGYAVSDSLSLADCCIHAVVEFLRLRDHLEKFPKVAASMSRLEENKHIAKWLKERPVTDY